MRDISYQEYQQALTTFATTNQPTQRQLLNACPHLTEDQVLAALTEGGSYATVALPPLQLTDIVQVGAYSNQSGLSYVGVRLSEGVTVPHAPEAIAYAQTHWPEQLVRRTWVKTLRVYVQEPTNPMQEPTTRFAIDIGLNRDLNDIFRDHRSPEWQQIDEATAIITNSVPIAAEIRVGGGGYTTYNCAICGGGLAINTCEGCNAVFKYDGARGSLLIPLGIKSVEFLEGEGHTFRIDPATARR